MRYIVYGAGAVGGVIGARLFEAGRDVILIARGAHLDVMARDGLTLLSPEGEVQLPIRAVGSPAEAGLEPEDVILLAMKSQDTETAVAELEALEVDGLSIVCMQNGVENERIVARRGFPTYGICVFLPATHIEPGVVAVHAGPIGGVMDIGRYPSGSDTVAETVAADLTAAKFQSVARPDIMRWKYAKLLNNLNNAIEATTGSVGRGSDLGNQARAEGEACLRAAGIDWARADEVAASRGPVDSARGLPNLPHRGGSTWQSLHRGATRVEADWLNGEIVLLGAVHGVDTPVNEALRRLANRMAREHLAPGTISVEEVQRQVQLQ